MVIWHFPFCPFSQCSESHRASQSPLPLFTFGMDLVSKPQNNVLCFSDGIFSGSSITNLLLELLRGGSMTGSVTNSASGTVWQFGKLRHKKREMHKSAQQIW